MDKEIEKQGIVDYWTWRRDKDIVAQANDLIRFDGTKKSMKGYLGPQTSKSGKTMSEYEVDGIPTLVPGLSKKEIEFLKTEPNPADIPDSIMNKAIEHADKRRKEGKSPFYQDGE